MLQSLTHEVLDLFKPLRHFSGISHFASFCIILVLGLYKQMPCWNFVSFPWLNIFRDVSTTTLEITTDDSQSISPIGLPLIDHMEDEYKLRELPLGSHTMMSHGVTVVRTHRHDWLVLILLVVMDVVLYVIHPFYRFVGKDMMSDLKYPLKTNTVPAWAVPMYAILLPMVIFLIVYSRRKDVYDLHHAILGLLFSVLVTAVITDSIKNAAGQPRPDFFWRCFPDGKDAYDKWGNVMCHGDKNVIKEGHKSFPSGHTSGSFAGLGFLSLYLSGKIKVFDSRGHIAKLCITFLPLLAACLVGISRVDDYWHHWQDVFAGGLLGLVVSSFCYLQFFPPPHDPQGWGPYAYFRALEESKASVLAGSAANRCNSVVMESQVENHEDESNGLMGLRLASYSRLETEDIEGGRSRGNAL